MKRHLPFLLFASFLLLLSSQSASAQGCVAIRPMSGCAGTASGSALLGKGQWQAGTNFRYFQSFRHFKSDSEQHERLEQHTEVINDAYSLDLGLSYGLTSRLSVSANLPLIYYDRSSLYEHYGNAVSTNPDHLRFHTGSKGIGDLRLSGSYWLLDPMKHRQHNVAVGLGIKLPTGDDNVQDEFHRRNATDGSDYTITKSVDQSIQLGDGGVGISLEVQGYAHLFENGTFYFNGFYMSNPRETNEATSRTTPPANLRDSIAQFYSAADQYVARFGVNYTVWPAQGLNVGLGFRAEGIPAKDLIGGDNGFRRPGIIVSVEPGIAYQHGNLLVSVNVPYALYRKRTKSVSDLADPTGKANGDAAFADYSLNIGLAYRFGGKKEHVMDLQAIPKFNDVKK